MLLNLFNVLLEIAENMFLLVVIEIIHLFSSLQLLDQAMMILCLPK